MQSSLSDQEKELLEQARDIDSNWDWRVKHKQLWKVEATDEWRQFYDRWRDDSARLSFSDKFPYVLELGVSSKGTPLLPCYHGRTAEDRILVTKSYNVILHRLLRLRQHDKGNTIGAVLTGQPGTGKTMFLKFMLVWLISANQVVILCDSYDTHLFYRGEVYSQSAEAGFKGIPTHRSMAYCPIWTLIDVDYKNKGPRISSDLYIWPIQATSPNLNRWKAWLKQNRATLLGMPLWNVEELMRGLPLTPEYDDFRSKLEKSLPLPDGSTLYTTDGKVESPNTSNNAINAALGILREREKVVEAEKNEDLDSMGDGFRSSATDRDEDMVDATGNKDTVDETGDEGMVDEAGQPPAPVDTVDNALEILVHNAIEEFGLAPRDVYSGLFEPRSTGRLHDNAVRDLDYTEMQKTVRFFSTKCGLDSATSHHLIVVFPRPHPTDSLLEHDRWAVDFKSIRIARKVTELMRLQNIERLWEMYQSFHRNPQSSTLAGWVFEAIVHRLLSGGCQSGPVLRPIRTDHNGSSDSPVFYTDPSPPTPDTSSSGPLRLRTRAVTGVNFTDCRLSDMTLKNGRYYIPTAAIRPLFDSFTIDVDSHTVVISLFRITISPRNEGLAEGYPHVRKIAVYANF